MRLLIFVSAIVLQASALRAATGDLLWTGQIGGNKATWSAPVISGSLVIVKGQDGGMTALNAADGTQAWYNPDIAASVTSPILSGGVLYLGADTHLYRIDPATGTAFTDRTMTVSVMSTAPALLAGHLYFIAGDLGVYSLYGVSAATLADVWSVPVGGVGSVLTDGVNIYSLSTSFSAHNPLTGAALWSVEPPTGFSIFLDGAYNEGYLVATLYSSATGQTGLGCWYLGNGASSPRRLWLVNLGTGADAYGIPPVIESGVAFIAASDGYLRAYTLTTGAPLWSYQVRNAGSAASRPVALDGKVYVQEFVGPPAAVCLNAATGAVIWRTMGCAGSVWGQPAVGGGKVYFAADWSGVYAFDSGVHASMWPMHKNNPAQTSASGDSPPPPPVNTAGESLLILLNEQ
jgi:outer membrane protein assembly factor BamB